MNKLRGKIVESGKSLEDLAASLGINRSTLYRKLAEDGMTFTVREANAIIKELQLTHQEAVAIFFTGLVA